MKFIEALEYVSRDEEGNFDYTAISLPLLIAGSWIFLWVIGG